MPRSLSPFHAPGHNPASNVTLVESDQRLLAGTALPNGSYGSPVSRSNSAFGRNHPRPMSWTENPEEESSSGLGGCSRGDTILQPLLFKISSAELAPFAPSWFPRLSLLLWGHPIPDRALGWLFLFRVIPSLPAQAGLSPAGPGHDQASPGHAVLCPTMPPAPTTDPPWSSLEPLPPVLAESGLQGFAPTGSPGFSSLGCSLVVCLRSFRFRLATDTLPFLATARIQLGRQVFHLLENSTAGHANTKKVSPQALQQLRALTARAKALERRERPARDILVSVWIPEDLDTHIRTQAGQDRLLRSWVVEQALRAYVNNHSENWQAVLDAVDDAEEA
jgi:hypothetical protein